MTLDLVIRGGTVLDGGGGAPIKADVAIADGRIVEVGRIRTQGADEIDAGGLYVAPGFIDIHSHSDYTLLVDPRAMSSAFQGVTLEVVGNCGFGCFPIRNPDLARGNIYGFDQQVPLIWSTPAGYLERLAAARPAVNVLTLVPNGQLRLAAVGSEQRPASPSELDAMQGMLREGLEAGAFGYSTGLEYPVERGAPEAEIEALCRTTARAGGYYATHTRERDAGSVEAVAEALRTAERAGIRLQISHLLPRSGHRDCRRCIELVDDARARGQDVAFDMHTRLFGLTYLATMLPPWATRDGPERLRANLRDPEARARIGAHRSIITAGGDLERVVLLDNDVRPQDARRSLAEIGRRRGQSPTDAALDILLEASGGPRAPMVIIHCYDESDQALAFAHPSCVPASDATALAPDGPLAGSAFHGAYTWAAWFWRFMVRDRRLLGPAEAAHKLTGQPAEILGLSDRGRIGEGMRADLAVFDPHAFAETGTTFEPNQLAVGMRHVIVNGVSTLRDGRLTGQRGGEVVRRH
jgi:N-acyl-D-amino-acid deacylase